MTSIRQAGRMAAIVALLAGAALAQAPKSDPGGAVFPIEQPAEKAKPTEATKSPAIKAEPAKDAPQADPKATDPKAADPKTTEPKPSDPDPKAADPTADPSKAPAEKGKAVEEERKLPTTPQEMLHVLGVDPSHYEMLVDGNAIDAAEDESLLKMVYAVRRFRTLRIHEWLNKRPNLAALREAPKNHRGDLVQLKGHVTAVEMLEPLPEQVARFELDKYYRCEMTLDADPPVSALIYSAAVPQAWLDPNGERPTEGWRSSLAGFFLKVGAGDRLVFVAPRVGWHPRGLLGDLGMDAGMFDNITPGPLTADDREGFYQMLHAMGQLGMHELNRRTVLKEGATTFSPSHVRDWPGLAKTLVADGRGPANTPGRSVWNRLSEPLRASLASAELDEPFSPELQQQVFDALNAIVADPRFFESHRWIGDQVSTAAAGLLAKGFARLPDGTLEQLNANLLAVGFAPALAPPATSGKFQASDVRDWTKLFDVIREQSRSPVPSPGRRMWLTLSPSLQNSIVALPEGEAPDAAMQGRLLRALNAFVSRPNVFDLAAWRGVTLPDELTALIDQAASQLNTEEMARFNRLLLEAAYPELLAPSQEFSVAPLFTQPQRQYGRLVSLRGTCRRAIRIPVDDPDIQKRFGIKHYYEMQVFTDDSQGNPVTFCVRELPAGMPQGEKIYVEIRVAGFFFKTWTYHIPLSAERRKQILARVPAEKHPLIDWEKYERFPAPLMIGRAPVWVRPVTQANPFYGIVAGGMFTAALLLVCMAVWTTSKSDEKFHQKILPQFRTVDASFAGIEVAAEANFRDYDPEKAAAEIAAREAAAASPEGAPAGTPTRRGRRYFVSRSKPMAWLGGGFSGLMRKQQDTDEDLTPRSGHENIFAGLVRSSQNRPSLFRSVGSMGLLAFVMILIYVILSLATPRTAPPAKGRSPGVPAGVPQAAPK